jgi:hypothetical protein
MSNADTPSEFAHDEQEFRRKFPCPLIATNLKGAYTIPAPSEDFDPTPHHGRLPSRIASQRRNH